MQENPVLLGSSQRMHQYQVVDKSPGGAADSDYVRWDRQ